MLALAFIKEKTMGKRRVILSRDIENLKHLTNFKGDISGLKISA